MERDDLPTLDSAADSEKQSEDVHVNRNYKDRVIRKLFGESKENALSLYNAINGSNYTNADDLEFDTIEDFLLMGMKNDISFLLKSEINLYEHQSTVCPNMPVRGVIYFGRIFQAYAHVKNLNIYGSKLQKFPTPNFVVLYNGEEDAPDYEEQKLSDAFETPGRGCMELTAKVYNINYGRNLEIMAKCEPLRGYAILIDKIRRYKSEGMTIEDAVNRAVDECIRENVLVEFLVKHKTEVAGMLLEEYEDAEQLRLEKHESREEGRKEGRNEGLSEGRILAYVGLIEDRMKENNMSMEEAMDDVRIPQTYRQACIRFMKLEREKTA